MDGIPSYAEKKSRSTAPGLSPEILSLYLQSARSAMLSTTQAEDENTGSISQGIYHLIKFGTNK